MNFKYSIITINKNNLNGLSKTINSILKQSFIDYELIIIDGLSTDGSGEYLKNLNLIIKPNIKILIEKDDGIYHAMNKGIKIANGMYLIFMNSGDYFTDLNTLSLIDRYISFDFDIFYGNYFHCKTLVELPSKINLNFFRGVGGSICHQSTIIKSTIFEEIGLYDIRYRYVADLHFILKSYLKGKKLIHINEALVYFDCTGVSGSVQCFLEKQKMFRDTVPLYIRLLLLPAYYSYILKWELFRLNKKTI